MPEPGGLARDMLDALRKLGACAERCEVKHDHPDYAELASGPLAVTIFYGYGSPPREYMVGVLVELLNGERVRLGEGAGASPYEALGAAVGRACAAAAALARRLLHLLADLATSPDECGDDADCRRAASDAERALAEFIRDSAERAAEAARALGCRSAGDAERAAEGVKLLADAIYEGCD